ncbi:hypothetical protein EDB86DRAFT_3079378 [Lactarius hatsudake]|nr:hypothetical protein EDB86DRAFT_3079378 [Lactarius hatsudake]
MSCQSAAAAAFSCTIWTCRHRKYGCATGARGYSMKNHVYFFASIMDNVVTIALPLAAFIFTAAIVVIVDAVAVFKFIVVTAVVVFVVVAFVSSSLAVVASPEPPSSLS